MSELAITDKDRQNIHLTYAQSHRQMAAECDRWAQEHAERARKYREDATRHIHIAEAEEAMANG